MKKIFSVLLCALLAGSCALTGCGGEQSSAQGETESQTSEVKPGNNVPDPIKGIKATASSDK